MEIKTGPLVAIVAISFITTWLAFAGQRVGFRANGDPDLHHHENHF